MFVSERSQAGWWCKSGRVTGWWDVNIKYTVAATLLCDMFTLLLHTHHTVIIHIAREREGGEIVLDAEEQ